MAGLIPDARAPEPLVLPPPHPLAPLRRFLTPIPLLLPVRKRIMRLQSEIAYVDSHGRVWRTEAQWCIDGASIPWFATWMYDRWDPRYLRSAGLHDKRFCVHDLPFRETNDLFHECLCAEPWHKPSTFRWAVSTPCGRYSYYNIPDLPENELLIQVAKAKFEHNGPEIWTPDTKPKLKGVGT